LGEVGSGMRGGHVVAAVERAGCYAPGGRYPLPSSILMTAITARVAGVHTVHVASPRPSALTLATAAIAGADGLLAMGGAQALAALVHAKDGIGGADVVVGPGNRFVTAAKKLLAGEVGIDMLAGPSELVVLADDSADPATIAADLIAQAEHDPHARTILIARGAPSLVARVREQLERQLRDLPTAAIARESLAAGAATVVDSTAAMIALCDHLAPEHLQVMLADAKAVAPRLRHYGGLFFGAAGAEVFGDYGLGPNHVLPTGGTARQSGGLSVFTFLRIRTFLELDRVPPGLIEDTAALARLEGLEGHARAAELRRE
ncbi:MAG: histidinol dehydrogenase, partial [Planctomycetota bacterium]